MVDLVLTMAGRYERFRLFGNKVPKYLMPLGTRTVLWHVIKKFLDLNVEVNICLLANERDIEFEPIVKSIMLDFGVSPERLKYIKDTSSQLETAMLSKVFFNDEAVDRPIVFANIDTVLSCRDSYFSQVAELKKTEALLDTFQGESHAYSYVQLDGEEVVKVFDKLLVSDMACSGLYGIGSKIRFWSSSEKILSIDKSSGFTEFYNKFLADSGVVYVNHNPNKKNTLVLGTPEEYITNLHKISQGD